MKHHFCIDPIAILVSHQAVPPTFYNKIAPMLLWELAAGLKTRLRCYICGTIASNLQNFDFLCKYAFHVMARSGEEHICPSTSTILYQWCSYPVGKRYDTEVADALLSIK